MTLDWGVVSRSWHLLMEGTRLTLGLFAAAILLATVVGLLLAVMKLSPIAPFRWLSTGYVWVFRGTPVLVTLFFAFFVLGRELGLSPFWSGVLGLGVDGGAYKAEIIRAGILAVDPGQEEASMALGMTKRHYMRRIIIPQAIRVIVPTYMSNAILLLKATSVAVGIGLVELTGITRQLSNSTFQPIELFTAAAVIYLALTTALVIAQEVLERRFVLKI
ncbi:MAG TPA: amino acid ABC transporter permease [Acidimicrobiia bacterium]|jgi:His/Glu/Gln/Arg/opine family amino acid ABC transporter permease subunit|nr:amino acid ABC transporter permease [Acidimicrobiia bacterium]